MLLRSRDSIAEDTTDSLSSAGMNVSVFHKTSLLSCRYTIFVDFMLIHWLI